MAFTTRKELLQGVHENREDAWQEFDRFYQPLVTLRARDLGLSPQEIDELKQNVRLAILRSDATGRYTPEKGRFRDYLRTLITNCAIDLLRARKQGENFVPLTESIPDENTDAEFEQEWRACLLQRAQEEVQKNCDLATYMAYQMYGERGLPVAEVAEQLGMTEAQVYQAKTRTVKRIQKELKRLIDELGD
ncbi:MAG: sigma-70 family RNA polymerase sigma factor [Victivallales bacterium]|nr:sigma-70 family RNA polymerase sigma factor [Victivallales bacterium]